MTATDNPSGRGLLIGWSVGSLASAFCILMVWAGIGEAAGPWKAQIVDAESGRSVEGVVVLAVWMRYTATLAGWAGGGYYTSEEVVTGPDGRFSIQSRWAYTIPLVTKVSGPEFTIFKPGYGRWQLRDPGEGQKFDRGEEVVIEMLPLKTKEERLKFHDTVSWSPLIPPERTTHLRKAFEEDRMFLGFGR